MSDIFKDMQANVGCDYISNLPSYKRKVWHEMKRLPLTNYDIKQLEDFSKYVFGMSYQSLKDVMNTTASIILKRVPAAVSALFRPVRRPNRKWEKRAAAGAGREIPKQIGRAHV